MNRGRFVLGAIIGMAAGVVAGLLAAPKSGKETRADLKEIAAELKENASRKTEELSRRSKATLDTVEANTKEYKARGEKAAEDIKQHLDGRA